MERRCSVGRHEGQSRSMAGAGMLLCVVLCLACLAVHDPRAELLQPRRFKSFDSETGAPAILQVKPLSTKKVAWELNQLMHLHEEGVLDDQDYNDAKGKIETKARSASAPHRQAAVLSQAYRSPQVALRRMGPEDLKRAQAVIAALNKVKKDHTYIEKQLKSPWRQDKKKLEEKDKLLADRMAKLESMNNEMKKKFAQQPPAAAAQHTAESDFAAPNFAAQDFAAPAPAPRPSFGYARSPAVSTELQRALGKTPKDYFAASAQEPSMGTRTARALGTDAVFMDPDSGYGAER